MMPAMQNPNSTRMDALRRAAAQWKRQLLDVTGRNRLLNYRDLKSGTIDLTPAPDSGMDARVLDALLAGKQIRMTALFPVRGGDEDAQKDARKRFSAIHKQARENLEEKGLDTLFLAVGLATWKADAGAAPRAPVALIPVAIAPEGAGRWEFVIEQSGEPSINPMLVHVLQSQHGLDLSADEETIAEAALNSWEGIERDLERFEAEWSKAPDFAIEPELKLGNFRYANMAMVDDLENNLDAFARNDLVAAIAGAPDAKDALAAKICDPPLRKPDYDPPESEFLILDADSSQHRAINRVLGGESLVIWGPPGTGKSQTIANLIASLAAAGKRALFVAEKRAAIDVVVARLDRAGLSDLVVDAHGGIKSKREFAQSMDDSIRKIRSTPAQDAPQLHDNLAKTRSQLVAHDQAMHEIRKPWGISLFDLQARLLGAPTPAGADLKMPMDKAKTLNIAAMPSLRSDIQEWVDIGGHTFRADYPEWGNSVVSTETEAREALETVRGLANGALSEVESIVSASLEAAGLPSSNAVADWRRSLEWLEEERQFQARHGGKVYEIDLASVSAALAPAKSLFSRLFASAFSVEYKTARDAARAALPNQETPLSDIGLLNALDEASIRLAQRQESGGQGAPRVPSNLDAALSAVRSLAGKLMEAEAVFRLNGLLSEPINRVTETVARLASQGEAAAKLPRVRELERRFEDAGIGHILGEVGAQIPPELAADAAERSWLNAVWDDLSFDVAGFAPILHNRRRREFVELDKKHLAAQAGRVQRRSAENAINMMNVYPDEAALIRREAAKKARHLPIRRLFRQAPHVLTAIRPCWTMSPLLAAELTPAGAALFDVVIFDEASQVPPAEAIGSLARAPQAVIAGDDRQLPPTTFFSGVDDEEDYEDDEADDAQSQVQTEGMGSILDVVKAGALREELLQWHYRSKDGRLIAFSNAHIYGESLTAFPDAAKGVPLSHRLVPFRSLPQRHTASHPDEVDKVVDMAIEHARRHPSESLGVIAFGIRHANNIEERCRLRLRELADPALEDFFSDGARERFFVKSIERVQGDERDVIILSVGYHKTANGALPYRFGPLNQEGGERRLNVAVTRARSRMHVVSSFSHRDMEPGRSSARGVELLRQYLEFAESGGSELGAALSDIPLNAFELDVLHRLQERGIPVTPQYGVAGYRIDFACAHPDQPGRMVLAIEADGASYHSGHTARERDRLRQEQLEARGWAFHRIWSTDWFKNRGEALERAAAAWKAAVSEANRKDEAGSDDAPPEESAPTQPPSPPSAPIPARGARPSIPPGYPISEYTRSELVALVKWILSDTLLRADEEIMAEMRRELGFQRRGSRIDEAMREAIAAARRPRS